MLLALALAGATPTHAATLDGVTIPDQETVNGRTLRLNGIGLRTASIFDIHVYVAGLFLEERSADPEAIIHSPRTKLLELHFQHDLSAERGRDAWMAAFNRTCPAPCQLPRPQVDQFLAAVPALRQGDVARLLFTPESLRVSINGREIGAIQDHGFEELILATFLGPAPASPRLKQELLGVRD